MKASIVLALPALFCVPMAAEPVPARGVEPLLQTGHGTAVRACAFSPDGHTLASVDGDGVLLLWSANDGSVRRRWRLGFDAWQVTFAPDGKAVLVAGIGHVEQVDVEEGLVRTLFSRPGWTVPRVGFTATGPVAALARMTEKEGERVVAEAEIVDARSDRRLRSIDGGMPYAVSRNGRYAVAVNRRASAAGDRDGWWVTVLDRGRRVREWESYKLFDGEKLGGPLEVVEAAVSDNGMWVATGVDVRLNSHQSAGLVIVTEVATGKPRYFAMSDVTGGRMAPGTSVTAIEFAPGSSLAAVAVSPGRYGGDTIALVDAVPPRHFLQLAGDPGPDGNDVAPGRLGSARPAVTALGFDSSGRRVALGDAEGRVGVVSTAGGEVRWFAAPRERSVALTVSSTERELLVGRDDDALALWDLRSGTRVSHIGGHMDGESSDDNRRNWVIRSVALGAGGIAVSGSEGGAKRWDLEAGTSLGLLRKGPVEVRRNEALEIHGWHVVETEMYQVRTSDDGSLLLTSGSFPLTLWNVSTGEPIAAAATEGHGPPAFAFLPDGDALVSRNGELQRWWPGTNEFKCVAPSRALAMAIAPTGAEAALGEAEGLLQVVAVEGGAVLRERKLPGQIFELAYGPDGAGIAVITPAGVMVLDAATLADRCRVAVQEGSARSVAFLGPRTLAVATGSGGVELHDAQDGRTLATLVSLDQEAWLVFAPDGLFDGSPAGWSRLALRAGARTSDTAPAEKYFGKFHRPGLLGELARGERPRTRVRSAEVRR